MSEELLEQNELAEQAKLIQEMRESMERHLRDSAEALRTVNWDRLDANGMLHYSEAHSQLAMALAQALQVNLLGDALLSHYGDGSSLIDVLQLIAGKLSRMG